MRSIIQSARVASVASVTTAYNASRILPRQIDALLRQTRPVDEIIVVDNNSRDNTVAMLADRYPHVTVIRMEENGGVGGALSAGLEYALLRRKHDWVWTFDDDSVPEDTALDVLVRSVNIAGPNIGIMASLPVHTQTGTCYPPLLWRNGFVKPRAQVLCEDIWFADLVISSGSMVSRAVAETIGLPRRDFFMDFVDYEYCLRTRLNGYKIAVATKSRFAHEIGDARRIQLLGFSKLWPNYAPWREYYMSRNITYAAWSLYPSFATKVFVVRHLLKHATGVVLFGSRKLLALRRMVQGFWDGVRAVLGTRFLPQH